MDGEIVFCHWNFAQVRTGECVSAGGFFVWTGQGSRTVYEGNAEGF